MFRHVWEIMRNCFGSLVLLSKCHQAQKVPQWHDGKLLYCEYLGPDTLASIASCTLSYLGQSGLNNLHFARMSQARKDKRSDSQIRRAAKIGDSEVILGVQRAPLVSIAFGQVCCVMGVC